MSKKDDQYKELWKLSREISLLSSIESILHWDNRTYMPQRASTHRADQVAYLAVLIHNLATEKRIGELLEDLGSGSLVDDENSVEAVNVREWKRDYDRRTKIPRDLIERKSRNAINAESAWIEARKTDDFELFKPWLEKTVELNIEVAECLGYETEPYDALLDEFEPGACTSEVAEILGSLRDELVPLIRAVKESPRQPDLSIVKQNFPIRWQRDFVKKVAGSIGYDFNRGRLDETTHPFCIELGPDDTRITTRYYENYFNGAFFGVIHEAGHGIYEQNLPAEHWGTPMAESVSLGIHESQSRMWENMVGRSHALWEFWFPEAKKQFDSFSDVNFDDFHFAVNQVRPSFIRVEADEVTYNLHILLRFELERALINREITVADVPGAWNDKFRKYFGLDLKNDSDGCLQDIHWAGGMMGYFPTYSLGNLNAAQFYAKANEELGNLNEMFRQGDFAPLKEWLTAKIHSQGKRYRSGKLIELVTGKPLGSTALVDYLKRKLRNLYRIDI